MLLLKTTYKMKKSGPKRSKLDACLGPIMKLVICAYTFTSNPYFRCAPVSAFNETIKQSNN
jgi:hypothetical protein